MTIGTPVQVGTGASNATANTSTAAVSNASAAGDLLVVIVGTSTSTTTITSVTDTAGNTYTAANNIAGTGNLRMFYCANAAALTTSDVITAHYGATGGTKLITAISVPGVATTTPLDVNGAGTTATGTTPSIATGTLAQAAEIVIGACWPNAGASDGYTESSGFTANSTPTLGTNIMRSAYEVVAATTTQTYAPVLGTSRLYKANVWTFKDAGGGISGVLSATIDAVTLSATGVLPIQAAASPTIAAVTSAATGTVKLQAVVGATIDPVVLTAHGGLQPINGVVSATIDPITLAATSTNKLQAVVAATIDPVTLSATGTEKLQAVASPTIAAVTLAATATVKLQAVANVTIDPVTGTETGALKIQGALSATIDPVTLSATSTISTQTVLQLGQNAAAAGSTTLVITTGIDCPAGAGIIVAAAISASFAVSGVTDSAGNTYVASSSGSTSPGFRQFFSANTAHLAAGGTITVTYASSTGEKTALAIGVPGLQLTSLLDQQSGVDHGTVLPDNSLATLFQQREFLFAAEGILAAATDTWTEQSGWTALTPATLGGGSNLILRAAYQISSVTTAPRYNPTGNTSRTYTGTFNTYKMQPFGVVAAVIDPVTLVATGIKPAVNGVLAATIDPVTLAATGTLLLQAAEGSTIAPVTLASTGTVKIAGVVASTIAAVTGSETGALKIQGVVGATIAPVTLAATATNKLQAVVAATIDPVTLVATAHLAGAFVTATLDPITLVATGQLKIAGVGGGTIAPVALAATGALKVQALAGGQIAPVTLVATATKVNRGTLSVSIGLVTILAHGGVQKLGVLNTSIGAITLSVGRGARRGHRGSLIFSGL